MRGNLTMWQQSLLAPCMSCAEPNAWRLQLAVAEQRCVLVETEVREEVSDEMADLLRSMEASYKVLP